MRKKQLSNKGVGLVQSQEQLDNYCEGYLLIFQFIVIIWKLISIMEEGHSHKPIIIKVIHQDKGKIIETGPLSYNQFISKLIKLFKLRNRSYYSLYYKDHEKDFIMVQTQQDFQIFLENPSIKKIYLYQTRDDTHHFVQSSPKQMQRQQKKSLVDIFKIKKEYFNKKLEQFEKEMKKEVEDEIKAWVNSLGRGNKRAIHQDIFCAKCPKKKSIQGARFECIKCNYYLCQKCQKNDDHIHPLIKILDQSQALASKNNMLMYDDQDLREVLRQRKQYLESLSNQGWAR